jgi:hypothetical protein
MKYSIRGQLPITDGSQVVSVINTYVLWRLITDQTEEFNFEVWLNTSTDKDSLFNQLKPFVDQNTGSIDWHECCHDEPPEMQHPCVISEEYRR